MKRLPLAAVAALAIAVALAAPAASENTPHHGTRHDPCTHHRHPGAEQRALARRVFAYSNWRSPAPGAGAVSTMRRLRGCAPARRRDEMAAAWKAAFGDLKLQHRYRLVAPEPGFNGEGRFLRWLPIPRYIVECETNGYTGDGRWSAINPSGAQGPAQLLGWPAPYPATTPAERVAYWEEAAYVMAVQGPSAWACA